jgi:hypothetical protein
MEMEVVKKLWEMSISLCFCYTTMLSDNANTSAHLSEGKMYREYVTLQKEECISHIQKRMGIAL